MAKRSQKLPQKTIENEVLGTLRLTAMLAEKVEYSGKRNLGGKSVELLLYSAEKSQDLAPAIACASKLVSGFEKVQSRLEKYLAKTVVPKINANLRPNDPLTPARFLAQLELASICVHANGKASFWYSPSVVLLSHALILYGASDGKISDFDVPG